MSFEPLFLMANGGMGAQVILNCLHGKQLAASMRCIAHYGRFIHLGKLDMKENSTVGMRMFLKNTSFCTVDVQSINDLSNDDKHKLQEMIVDGIDDLTVKPLPRKVMEHQDILVILK